MKQCNLVSL